MPPGFRCDRNLDNRSLVEAANMRKAYKPEHTRAVSPPRWQTLRTRSHLCLSMMLPSSMGAANCMTQLHAVAHKSALNSSRSNCLISSLSLRTKFKQGHCLLQAAWPIPKRKQVQSRPLHRLWSLLACVLDAATPAAPSSMCQIKKASQKDTYCRCANVATKQA